MAPCYGPLWDTFFPPESFVFSCELELIHLWVLLEHRNLTGEYRNIVDISSFSQEKCRIQQKLLHSKVGLKFLLDSCEIPTFQRGPNASKLGLLAPLGPPGAILPAPSCWLL